MEEIVQKLGKELERMVLKKNAYKRDYQKKCKVVDKVLTFYYNLDRKYEELLYRETCHTLWLEFQAEERNIELAKRRNEGFWLLEAAVLEDFFRKNPPRRC